MLTHFLPPSLRHAWVQPTCLLVNHLLAQQPALQARLVPLHGKTLTLALGQVAGSFTINGEGFLAPASLGEKPADTTLAVPWAVVLDNLANPAAMRRQVQLQGDADLAQAVVAVLSALRWDAELDLSKVVGEVPAVWAVRLLKAAGSTVQQAFVGTVNALREYLVYERGVLPSQAEFDDFRSHLASLRDHVARLEKRVDLLTTQHKGPGV